ncbi:MAG TPA: uroporphyrin-III methyltransferase, partial [Alphaproteobacteria bacterium]|nr:uroporphyrin-III methyltransferase [Alphaproteobacteria bacterium]
DALAQADVVFFDALVDESVLGFAAPGAQLVDVGKRGGVASVRQAEITALLIARARAGQRIVRLKGGDPYIFGRGAEEALALADAGVPFRVVPGVTAGLGGLGV